MEALLASRSVNAPFAAATTGTGGCLVPPSRVAVLGGPRACPLRCRSMDSLLDELTQDDKVNATELVQWENGKSINDIAASQGIRIRRHHRPTVTMKEIEKELGAPRTSTTSNATPLATPGRHHGSGRLVAAVQKSSSCIASPTIADAEDQTESEVAMGYTMIRISDKFIEFFMHKKPETKDWRKVLVFREEWQRYREHFYKRCQVCIDMETDSSMKQKLVVLARKVKKIDGEIEKHMELFTELRENPSDINAIVARRRKDFTGEFFGHLNFLLNAYNGLDERDGVVRLGAKCLSAIHAYDCTLEQLDIESAQSKFDDILNSSSLDDACDKIKSLAKAKELDSSLILLINRAWAAAKDSITIKDQVKDIMYHIYTTMKESLKIISPPEMKLLKYLLNIEDPEERFGALASAFSLGDEREVKGEDALYTTPNELHKWIKMMLDSYHLNKEETDFMDARKMSDPVIIQRLILLKETIEEEYMKQYTHPEEQESMGNEESEE